MDLRDNNGESLMHSRRSFVGVLTLEEAKEKALEWTLECWTLECLITHRVDRIIIAGEDTVLLKVIERPKAWPSFTSISQKMRTFLDRFTSWKSSLETRSANRCAFLIADSAVMDRWYQSYVARGAPFWISSLLAYEKR